MGLAHAVGDVLENVVLIPFDTTTRANLPSREDTHIAAALQTLQLPMSWQIPGWAEATAAGSSENREAFGTEYHVDYHNIYKQCSLLNSRSCASMIRLSSKSGPASAPPAGTGKSMHGITLANQVQTKTATN